MQNNQAKLLERAEKEIEKNKATVESDPYRLTYHIAPPVGLLNDPNGLIYFKGEYHVFYQWYPFATAHGVKFWFHVTSKDLIHWDKKPIALAPGDWFDKNGCFSGSAIEHSGNMYLFYTGNVRNLKGERVTYQCLAVSNDGITFKKIGPLFAVPPGYTAHFRDPKVWKYQGRWYMILGAQTIKKKGSAVLFLSLDLVNWEFIGPISGANKNSLKDFGYMWECPDLFRLNGADVLLVSPQGLRADGYLYHNLYQTGYFTGHLDYQTFQYYHSPFTELDRGFDFYATQTMQDPKGRRILFAWMGLPEENEMLHPTIPYKWIHALTIPREIHLRNGRLYQKPVEELKKLRKSKNFFPKAVLHGLSASFTKISGITFELLVEDIEISGRWFSICFRGEAKLLYDLKKRLAIVEREQFDKQGKERRTCYLRRLEKVQVFGDRSSLEIFINDGEEVFTLRYFPDQKNTDILFSTDTMMTASVTKWDLQA
ncbi:sucrose-6-phosphate hydrolase [Bacillaceae bacterium Marseille-Q3522]|nr:sucrose-6-phosphate hydrolase [Bacillaceae bacterium Marseille-Q3522]